MRRTRLMFCPMRHAHLMFCHSGAPDDLPIERGAGSLHPSMAGTGFFTTSAKMGLEKQSKTQEKFSGALAKKGLSECKHA